MLKRVSLITILTLFVTCQGVFRDGRQTFSAADLARQYEESPSRVRSRFEGKEIVVRGYAIAEAEMPDEDEYEGLIALESTDDDRPGQVMCWFSRKEAAEFAKVRGEQHITVTGVFNGEVGAELRFCKLVKVE